MKALIFCFLAVSGFARDCVPLTYSSLSFLVGVPIKEETLVRDFFPNNEKEPLTLAESLKKWSKFVPDIKLVAILGPNGTVIQDIPVVLDAPYFWVGEPAPDMAPTGTPANEVHAGIVYLYSNHVILVNTIAAHDNGTFDLFLESLTYDVFFKRTVSVYGLSSKNPIHFRPLCDLIGAK